MPSLSSRTIFFWAGICLLLASAIAVREYYYCRKQSEDLEVKLKNMEQILMLYLEEEQSQAPSNDPLETAFENDKSPDIINRLFERISGSWREAKDETAPLPEITDPPFKTVTTTLFWVGETADDSNNFIANDQSYWDTKWQENFGGLDDPNDRCGYRPCAFTPRENPFYFALPYGEYDENYRLKPSLKNIPWYEERDPYVSLLKNRWIEIRAKGRIVYAQWQDVGPLEMDDFDYVFGPEPHKNRWGAAAGLDVSPAVWDFLGMTTNEPASWRFVDFSEVPAGPWLEMVTK